MNETAKIKYQHNTEIDKDRARKTFPLIIFVVFFLNFCIDLDLDWIRYYLLNALFNIRAPYIHTYTHIFFSDYLLNYFICVIYGYKNCLSYTEFCLIRAIEIWPPIFLHNIPPVFGTEILKNLSNGQLNFLPFEAVLFFIESMRRIESNENLLENIEELRKKQEKNKIQKWQVKLPNENQNIFHVIKIVCDFYRIKATSNVLVTIHLLHAESKKKNTHILKHR